VGEALVGHVVGTFIVDFLIVVAVLSGIAVAAGVPAPSGVSWA
jgi:hypothetical protein